jgi:hypothetical protein
MRSIVVAGMRQASLVLASNAVALRERPVNRVVDRALTVVNVMVSADAAS